MLVPHHLHSVKWNIFLISIKEKKNTNLLFSKIFNRAPGGSVGRAGAPHTEAVSSPQQLRVRFHLQLFSASPLFPVYSSAVLKYLKKIHLIKN